MFTFVIKDPKDPAKDVQFQCPLFPPEVKKQLFEFCACAASLNETGFVRDWDHTKIEIGLKKDGRIVNKGVLPPQEDIDAFLHRLRPIYLQNDGCNFNVIAKLVSRHLRHPFIADWMRELQRVWDGRHSQQVFEISVAGTILNSTQFFDHYINALEYHRDPERKKHIDKIAEHFPVEAQRPLFVLLLQMRLNAINKLASFLNLCLGSEDGKPIIFTL